MLVTRIFHEFQEVSSSFDFSDTQGLTVCDYGSSQGKNSSMLFASVLPGFRKAKVGPNKLFCVTFSQGDSVPILLYHNDVPHNDWGTLFDTSNSEVYKDKNIFVSGIGHSFSSQILPPRFFLANFIKCLLFL